MLNEKLTLNQELDVYPSRIKAKLEIIPRKDPVVYSEWTPESAVTEEQSDFYEQNGYLFLEQFFTEEEITEFQEEARRLQISARTNRTDVIVREPNSDEVRSVFAIHRINAVFQKLSRHPRLMAIVEYILGGQTYIHQSRINYKPGFTGKEFYWHSDFETWHVEDGMPRMRALSCSIALEDNFHYNGPLMVVPGSHKQFVACVGTTPENHFKHSLRKQQYGVPDDGSLTELVKQGGIDTPVGKAGSVVLFDCNIMHGSNSNITPLTRSNVFIVYNSVHNKVQEPFSGQRPRPEFIATRKGL
ncbi:ectoine hydroxylase [Paenibacillus xerothermodurans]|uniref:Ectoine hydroxylase n=1 Tax=Paenibacillus xerothermodurans TaxID=1977292 RepID=A0A2W1NKS2_PAEXE|nr:ectoine hydroxylase [Paenibacillus xerothermodurans]PZE19643.1 ectoine hydroxylase [Paenibacillus xerothermodurans]